MNSAEIKTDDKSFSAFLFTICNNCLVEYMYYNMLPDAIVEVILKNEYLHRDCYEMITGFAYANAEKSVSDELRTLLDNLEEDSIVGLTENLFSKKLMIDTLLEYTNEYARMDIIENQMQCKSGTH